MATTTSSDSFRWEVTLPDRRSSSLHGAQRLKATLSITTGERGEEHLSIPLSVGKTLLAEQESEKYVGESRAEVLYHVRELSLRHASSRVSRLVDKRDYSTQELDEKLRLDGYHASVREEVIARAIDYGLISDERYASVFARTKLASGWGTMRIERELARRGIDVNELRGWPDDYLDGQDEDARALAIARTRRVSEKRGYEKLVRYLTGRGYSLACAMRVARQVVDENQDLDG